MRTKPSGATTATSNQISTPPLQLLRVPLQRQINTAAQRGVTMANTSTVQQLPNGQITLNIPRAIAQAMGYKKGDTVAFGIAGQDIVLQKINAARRTRTP
jgi:hypothetical protein